METIFPLLLNYGTPIARIVYKRFHKRQGLHYGYTGSSKTSMIDVSMLVLVFGSKFALPVICERILVVLLHIHLHRQGNLSVSENVPESEN
jgi:hypothetical protein